jgi:hypothetical protein
MPHSTNLQHSVNHIGNVRNDLEIEWNAFPYGRISCMSFDRRGRFCALYSEKHSLLLCDTQTLLIPQVTLPLPKIVSLELLHCSGLAWSYDANFILGNFYRKIGSSGYTNNYKRKSGTETYILSSYLVLWDVKTQKIVHESKVPFTVSNMMSLQVPYLDNGSQKFSNYFLLSTIYTEAHHFHPYMFYNVDSQSFHPVVESFTVSPTASAILHWKLREQQIPLADICTLGSYENLRRLKEMNRLASSSSQDSPNLFLAKQFMLFPANSSPVTSSYNLSVIYNHHQSKSSYCICMLRFHPVLERSPTGEWQLKIAEFENVSQYLLTDILAPSTQQQINNPGMPMKSKYISAIEFSSDYSQFFVYTEGVNLIVFSNPKNSPVGRSSMIQKIAEFAFDSRLFTYNGIHFLNTDVNQRRYGVTVDPSSSASHNVLVMNCYHKIQNHSQLLIWNYSLDLIDEQNSAFYNPTSHQLQETVSASTKSSRGGYRGKRQENSNNNNINNTNDGVSKSIMRHSFAQIFQKILIQPLETIHENHSNWNENRVQMIFGLDTAQRLWSCSQFFFSNFAGSMFPIGYRIIDQIQTYIEKEDEMDHVVVVRASEEKINLLEEPPQHEAKMEICTESSSIVLVSDSLPVSFKISTFPRVTGGDPYLVQLPSDITVFLSDLTSSSVATNKLDEPLDEMEVDEDDFDAEVDEEGMIGEENIENSNLNKPKKNKKSSQNHSTFPALLNYYLPPPNRVATGDFQNKINREKQIHSSIQQLNENPIYVAVKFNQVKEEAVKNLVKGTIGSIRKKRTIEEKRQIRQQNKAQVLNSLLKDYNENLNKLSQDKKLKSEIRSLLGEMVLECEKRFFVQNKPIRLEELKTVSEKFGIKEQKLPIHSDERLYPLKPDDSIIIPPMENSVQEESLDEMPLEGTAEQTEEVEDSSERNEMEENEGERDAMETESFPEDHSSPVQEAFDPTRNLLEEADSRSIVQSIVSKIVDQIPPFSAHDGIDRE